MTSAYCTCRDVYDLGLSARSFVVVPRALDPRQGDFMVAAAGVFSMVGHGFASDDLVRFVLVASGGAVPTGAVASAVYHPLPLDYFRFQLSTTEGGTASLFSDTGVSTRDGTSSWGLQVDPERRLQRIILQASADIDQDLTAYSGPLLVDPVTGLYPMKVVSLVARIVARRAILGNMFENSAAKVVMDRLLSDEKRDDEQRAAWRLGQPIKPEPRDQTAGVPDNGARATNRVVSGNSIASVWGRGTL